MTGRPNGSGRDAYWTSERSRFALRGANPSGSGPNRRILYPRRVSESGSAGGLLGGASDGTIVSPSPSASDTRPRTHMFSRRIVVDNVTQGMSNPLLVFIEAPEKER